MVEEIVLHKELLAIIVRDNFEKQGVTFFTTNELSQQLAFIEHPKGKIIEPHLHNPVPREVHYTQEVLFIKSGILRVDFFDDQQVFFESRILNKGDVILLIKGGHGFEVCEDLQMIEVKQGPYVGEKDKTRFNSITAGKDQ
jgi:mannose-6-phosphate isomerase-like protein (cupin superfamily)